MQGQQILHTLLKVQLAMGTPSSILGFALIFLDQASSFISIGLSFLIYEKCNVD